MTAKKRFIAALERKMPDRLPVTTHHLMKYFLDKYMGGISNDEFFDYFGLDPILWLAAQKPDEAKGESFDPNDEEVDLASSRQIVSPNWHIETEDVPGQEYKTTRFSIVTPKKTLSMVLQSTGYTNWVTERLIKEKTDIEIIAAYAPAPACDVDKVNRLAEEYGERGLVRGNIPGFDIYGQPGCWQDAACLYGTENLILATFDDPAWVHEFLRILKARKKAFVESMTGARFDLVEHGGGDASSTVISPRLFDEFVAPYDAELIALAHAAGQRVVYHTCGGMMPILENIAAMDPDAMETFTPSGMGGDVDLLEAKRRIGSRVSMIGGFDQFHYFSGCSAEETRRAVRRCFEEAGEGGGYILSPSDHFFDADPELIMAYADEARRCVY
ncbi:MAG: uroporphyrinogen decarboxylase family protein [Clostridiales bacterium]|nr:uroporphyrinogen decarboxylase family protein [Clostridiales bacterium]